MREYIDISFIKTLQLCVCEPPLQVDDGKLWIHKLRLAGRASGDEGGVPVVTVVHRCCR